MRDKKTLLTKEGLKELQDELDDLINVKRPANLKAIKEARALGDLSENADYDAAKNDQAELEGRIKKIEKMLENYEIIEKKSNGKVGLGSTVNIKYIDDDEEDEYKIVGSQEADPFESKISNESPLGAALLGKKKGDEVEVKLARGSLKVSILKVS